MKMYELAQRLFKIYRSITGDGTRQTLKTLHATCPLLTVHEVPSGTQVFDWTVPKEYNVNDAWIKDSEGRKVVDFKENNLHLVGYSTPVHKKVSLSELLDVVYTLPEQPDLVPYVNSYYKERYGFCMSENQKKTLKDGEYEVFIDSSFKGGTQGGALTYGEIIIKGKSEKEILLSTYICHPQMANNELSGPVVAIELANWLSQQENEYTYRIIFVPETIGSIVYLSKNLEQMKKNTVAGFVLTCCGDDLTYSYLQSPYGDTLSDRVARNVLKYHYPEYKTYSFLERGSDERQYCSVGVDLPVCSVMRSKYGEYPEYHTSADDLSFISQKGLEGALNIYKKMIVALEKNKTYRMKLPCEPQLGKRGLYPNLSHKGHSSAVKDISNFIAYADGKNDLIEISDIIGASMETLIAIADKLKQADLIEVVK